MRESFLVFGQPSIQQEEIDEVTAVMESAWLGTGPKVKQFEAEFASYKAIPYAAALNSATAGLHLSCIAIGLKPGDEVITTAMTFCATANAIIHAGARPVLADIDPVTWNISPDDIEKRITPHTRAILPVHFAGRSCEMDAIMALARKHHLHVIEDCAHAIETTYKGKPSGSFGDFGVFSFYATKNLATGEGGMVLSSNEEGIARIKMLGLHGMSRDAWMRFSDAGYKHYYVEEAGFKYNMMDLQAAIGIHQLRRVEQNSKRRNEIWQTYMEAFADLPIGLPAQPEPYARHALHLFIIRIDDKKCGVGRDRFLELMTARRIGVGVHYLALPEHPYYRRTYDWKPDEYPVATRFGRECVSLPLSAKLSDQDVADVIEAVREIVAR